MTITVATSKSADAVIAVENAMHAKIAVKISTSRLIVGSPVVVHTNGMEHMDTSATTMEIFFLVSIRVPFVDHPVALILEVTLFQMALPSSGAACADTGEDTFAADIPIRTH